MPTLDRNPHRQRKHLAPILLVHPTPGPSRSIRCASCNVNLGTTHVTGPSNDFVSVFYSAYLRALAAVRARPNEEDSFSTCGRFASFPRFHILHCIVTTCVCILRKGSPSKAAVCYREQHDRLMGEGRLIHPGLRVKFPSCANRF